MTNKICNTCKIEKDVSEFHRKKDGYLRYNCKKCFSIESVAYRRKSLLTLEGKEKYSKKYRSNEYREKVNKKRREARKENKNVSLFILQDSKASDKKKKLGNDLTLEFIKDTIGNGCLYCGENTLRMTLDRIDNTKGHLQDNVNPACVRCNYMRKNMPYEAWICFSSLLKDIRCRGLFSNWIGR